MEAQPEPLKAVVGIYAARLAMPWVRSLKEKRSLVRPVLEQLKSRFPVSAARLDETDSHAFENVGFVVIGSSALWVERVLQEAAAFLAQGDYGIEEERWQIEILDLSEATSTARYLP
jgi:hypothetical protein